MLKRVFFSDVICTLTYIFSLLLIFGVGATLAEEEGVNTYFPHALGSYWIYEDQNGNEFTRRAAADKTIAGETYRSFNYEPILEDWVDYDYHIHPNFCQVSEEWVTFLITDDAKKAFKARLTEEMEIYRKMVSMNENVELLYDVRVEVENQFYMLPVSGIFNEKWDATKIKAKVTITPEPLIDPGELTLEFTIVETGKVLGTENVETPAGTFEDCLKIEYRTETGVVVLPLSAVPKPPGESVTTLWVMPNIGIVKFHQEAEGILLKTVPELKQLDASIIIKTLELKLKKYEVKSAN